MRRKIFGSLSIMVILLWLVGCAHSPDYKLNDVTSLESPRHAMKIAVAPLKDWGPKPGNLRVSEKGISSMIVKHFEHVKLFAHQEVVGEEFKRPDREQLSNLKVKGYKALLIGSINYYMGHRVQSDFARDLVKTGQTVTVMGPFTAGIVTFTGIGLVVAGEAQKAKLTGYADLEFELIRIPDGVNIWKGNASGGFAREGSGIGAYKFADEALKNAIIFLVQQLRDANLNEALGNKGVNP
jgi:hypothetical protein